MDIFKKLIITNVSILAIVFVIILYFELFSVWTFVSILFYASLYIIGYSYITYNGYLETLEKAEVTDKKYKFNYCFSQISQWMSNQPGGESLTWDSGKGCTTDTKSIPDRNNKDVWYRAFIVYTSKSQNQVLIIYNMDTGDVVKYRPQPLPEEHENIWHDFKPYDSTTQQYQPWEQNNYGRIDRRTMPRRNYSYNQNNNNSNNSDDEYESYVNRAKAGLNSYQDNE